MVVGEGDARAVVSGNLDGPGEGGIAVGNGTVSGRSLGIVGIGHERHFH
jgi:hypothetical protein